MHLRDVTLDDLDIYLAMRCDPAMMTWLGGPLPAEGIAPKVRLDVASVAADTSWICMIVEDGEVAGQVVLWPSEREGVTFSETGWMVLPAFQGRGVATAAMRLLLQRADADGRWGEIRALPGVENAASNGVCRALGFRPGREVAYTFQGRSLLVREWIRPAGWPGGEAGGRPGVGQEPTTASRSPVTR